MSLKSARGREPPARVGACVLVRNRSHEESFITDEQYQPQQMSESRARALEEKVIVKSGSIGTPFANEKLLLTQ
tara:strand:+ start:176 stop:397 length:222 start_codon:yes stop_codon:yes gene_type:complete